MPREQHILAQTAQQKDKDRDDHSEQETLTLKLALRNRSLYRHGPQHDKESYAQMGLALLAQAPSTLLLEQKNLKNEKRFEYLIFNQDKTNYYLKYSELKKSMLFTMDSAIHHPPATHQNEEDIQVAPQEDAYLRGIYAAKYNACNTLLVTLRNDLPPLRTLITSVNDGPRIEKLPEIMNCQERMAKYSTYELFLDHLKNNRMTELTPEQNALISPLFLCYLRRKTKLQGKINQLRNGNQNTRNNPNTVKNNMQSLDDNEPDLALALTVPNTVDNNTGYKSIREIVTNLFHAHPANDEQASKLAVLETEFEAYATYDAFLNHIQNSPELDNDDEFEAYGEFIEAEIKKLNITAYGWGSEEDHIVHLSPDNKTAFVDAALKSAPEVGILTLISKAVPETAVNLSFGIAANVLLVPLFFYNFHESVEIAKYQKNNRGVKPDELSDVFKNIQKDSKILGGQTFMAAIIGAFVMNNGLHHALNFNPMEHLINGISPGSLIPGELTSGLRSAALQALPWWVNLSAAALCGAVVGFSMMALSLASTWKDKEFSWVHVGASFALGFAAGSLMYASSACSLGNNKAVSDVFGLAINGLLGLGLHWALPKSRYQTLDQKNEEATKKPALTWQWKTEPEPKADSPLFGESKIGATL